jgi:protein subunit release factor A
MAWSKEQLQFIEEYLDDFQYSIFLVEKENNIKDILFFFENGELNSDNFKDVKNDINKLEEIKTKYISLNKPFEELEKIIQVKKDKLKKMKDNVSDETIKEIQEKYDKKIQENSYEYLHFDSKKIKVSLTDFYKDIEKGLFTHNKIIFYNYIAIGIVSIAIILYKVFN